MAIFMYIGSFIIYHRITVKELDFLLLKKHRMPEIFNAPLNI